MLKSGSLIILLTTLFTMSGCSFFVGPQHYAYMTAAEQSAMYKKMTQETLKVSAAGAVILGTFLLSASDVSDKELQEKWAPAGIKKFMKGYYRAGGSGSDKGDDEIVTAHYKAYISNSSFYKLGVPMMHAARFCTAADGTFVRTKPFTYSLPTREEWANPNIWAKGKWTSDLWTSPKDSDQMGWYNAIQGGNDNSYWGEFECSQKDGKWWSVTITPDISGGRMNAISCGAFDPKCDRDVAHGFNIDIKINVHTTKMPEVLLGIQDVNVMFRFPKYDWGPNGPFLDGKKQNNKIERVVKGQKVLYEIWAISYRDTYGCFIFGQRASQGDRNITAQRGKQCD